MNALRFHHIGVACTSIDAERARFALLGYVPESEPFVDRTQGVRGTFLVGPGLRVELLEQLPGSTVLESWLRANIRLYHQAFEVDDIEAAISDLRRGGAVLVAPATPAVAFDGRAIAFLLLPGVLLVELVQGDVTA